MWRVVVRQLMCCHELPSDFGKRAKLGAQGAGVWLITKRPNISVAAIAPRLIEGSTGELVGVEVGWELRPASALAFGASSTLSCPVPNPLEGSVTALDEALYSAVQLRWLANPTWWMQLISDSKADGLDQFSSLRSATQSAFRNSVGTKSFVSSAAAVEIVEEEDVGNNNESIDQEPQREQAVKPRKETLRERQMRIESMAWQAAAEEYKELLLEMCKKNLAPNLPYVQSLVLGWFEPFKKAIAAEQLAIQNLEFKEHRAGYACYITLLPADIL